MKKTKKHGPVSFVAEMFTVKGMKYLLLSPELNSTHSHCICSNDIHFNSALVLTAFILMTLFNDIHIITAFVLMTLILMIRLNDICIYDNIHSDEVLSNGTHSYSTTPHSIHFNDTLTALFNNMPILMALFLIALLSDIRIYHDTHSDDTIK